MCVCLIAPALAPCRYQVYPNKIVIVFTQSAPLTAERYGLDVWSQPYLTAQADRLGPWTNLEWPTTVADGGRRQMVINTDPLGVWESCLPPGERPWGRFHPARLLLCWTAALAAATVLSLSC